MKITYSAPPPIDDVQRRVAAQFPQYKVYVRYGKILVVEKSAAVGATALTGKNAFNVQAAFPNMGLQILFTLLMIGLGILIPLVLYFALLYGKQKAVQQEVGGFLQATYGGR